MDEVKVILGEGPVLRGVFDFELEVGGDPGRLVGRDVGADNGASGELVCEVDGPDS